MVPDHITMEILQGLWTLSLKINIPRSENTTVLIPQTYHPVIITRFSSDFLVIFLKSVLPKCPDVALLVLCLGPPALQSLTGKNNSAEVFSRKALQDFPAPAEKSVPGAKTHVGDGMSYRIQLTGGPIFYPVRALGGVVLSL